MRRLFLIAAVATLAMAKPGLYREKEDFQFARSSTDEGSKSGFYGAQRGNMGGNYERAHNMDGLAQNQMSGLVRQVEGELGDASKTRSGSVFTAANSRGVYGSGHYDLSNLEGRNFQEGVSYGDSQSQSQQSHSSLAAQSGYNAQSSALNNAAYSSLAQNSRSQNGYTGYQYLGQNVAATDLQQAENLHSTNQYDYGGREASGYYSQSAYNGQSNSYDQSKSNLNSASSYGSNAHGRIYTAVPVKVVLRPGTRVAVPIATQTYDSANNAAYDQNSASSVSSINSLNQNSEAELLSNQNQHNSYKPAGAKHYESSYSYRKEWEKHDTKPVNVLPVVVPTVNPFPKNSELYEDVQGLSAGQQYTGVGSVGSQSSHSHSRNTYGGYNANVDSAALSQSRHQSTYNTQHQSSVSASDSAASLQGTYNSGVGIDTTNHIENVDSKPKSYHSSYSYHKSWERQGDPYVIKPASSGYDSQASQRLTASSNNQGTLASHHYGSHYQQINQNQPDCDETGHIRVARSYNTNQFEEQNSYQQNQYNYDQEALSQQSQNLEDLTQQSENKWDRIEDLGQQTQSQWDNLEDAGQQTQSQWDRIEDAGQQSQSQWDKIEDLGQQAQNKFDKIEDLGQQAQNKFDKIENLGQQTQTQWDKIEDAGQQTQSKWDNFDGQQTQLDGQQLQNTWNQFESGSYAGMGQETQANWDNLDIAQQDKSKERLSPKNEEPDSHILKDPHSPTGQNEYKPFTHHENIEPINNGNNPTPTYNNFNHPWFKPTSDIPQHSDQSQNNNNLNQQAHTYNAWNNHQTSFSESHSQNNWHNSYFNHHPTTDTNHHNTPQDRSPLWSLWNKVDTIEKQTTSSNNTATSTWDASENVSNLTTSIQNKPNMHQNGHNLWVQTAYTEETSTSPSSTTTKTDEITSATTEKHKQILVNNLQPADVGRGDIGPEDTSDGTSEINTVTQEKFNEFGNKPTFDVFVPASESKLYKTPTEIEALSQVLDSNKTTSNSTSNFKERDYTTTQQEKKFSFQSSTTSHPIAVMSESATVSDETIRTQMNLNDDKWSYSHQQNKDNVNNMNLGQQPKNISKQNGENISKLNNEYAIQRTQSTDGKNQNMGQYNDNITTVEFGKNNHFDRSYGQQSDNIAQQFESSMHPGDTSKDMSILKQGASTESISSDNGQTQNPLETGFHTIPLLTSKPPWRESSQTGKTPSHELETDNFPSYMAVTHKEQTLQTGRINNENGPITPPSPWNEIVNLPVSVNNKNWEPRDDGNSPTSGYENFNIWLSNLAQQSQTSEQNNNFDNQQSNTYTDQKVDYFEQQNDKFDQQNTDQQFENFDQQMGKEEINMEQQSESISQQVHTFNTYNTEQTAEDLKTQPNNITNDAEKFYTTPLIYDAQETDQQFEQFNQNNESLGAPVQMNIGSERNDYSSYHKFEHPTESFDQSNWNQEDLGQQLQTVWEPYKNLDEKTNAEHLEVIPVEDPVFKSTIKEDSAQKPQIIMDMDQTTQHTTPIDTPSETESEKPGFWKSVGNKFVSAKDKVFSWFGSSSS